MMVAGAEIATGARRYLGTPYQFGGRSRGGADCVGLAFQMIPGDFGFSWQVETPAPDPDSGYPWESAEAMLQGFGFRQIPVTAAQLGDLVVVKIPFGGAGTCKIVSGVGGWASFFGVSTFIHYVEPTILIESGPTLGDMATIKRDLKMDMQEYVKRLWRIYRYPFVEDESLDATAALSVSNGVQISRGAVKLIRDRVPG